MSLTFEDRHQLRQQVSEALKARLPKPKDGCAGCGGHRSEYTQGCDTCTDRKNRRAQRERKRQLCANNGCTRTIVPEYNRRHHRPHSGYCQDCWRQSRSWSNCD